MRYRSNIFTEVPLRAQYDLCDWCVFKKHNEDGFCNFSRESELSERLLFLLLFADRAS